MHDTCRYFSWARSIVGNREGRHEVFQCTLIRALCWQLQNVSLHGKFLSILESLVCHSARMLRHSLGLNAFLAMVAGIMISGQLSRLHRLFRILTIVD